MGIHAVPMTSREAMRWTFDAVTINPSKAMHLAGYGLAKGCKANFVVLQAKDPIDAIRLKANRLAVVRAGKVIAETPETISTLAIEGRPQTVNGAHSAPLGKSEGQILAGSPKLGLRRIKVTGCDR